MYVTAEQFKIILSIGGAEKADVVLHLLFLFVFTFFVIEQYCCSPKRFISVYLLSLYFRMLELLLLS